MQFQARHCQMWLQVSLAVRGQTHQAGLQSSRFGFGADVAGNLSRFGNVRMSFSSRPFEMRRHLGDERVDLQIEPAIQLLLAGGAVTLDVGVPVLHNANFAEVVSTGNGDWVSEHILADAAQKMLLGEQTDSG